MTTSSSRPVYQIWLADGRSLFTTWKTATLQRYNFRLDTQIIEAFVTVEMDPDYVKYVITDHITIFEQVA